MFIQQMELRNKELEIEIKKLQKGIAKFPKGTLTYRKNGKYVKWFSCVNKTYRYLDKGKLSYKEKLAYKKYLTNLLEDYQQEQFAIFNYINHFKLYPPKAPIMLEKASIYHKFLSPYFHPISEELSRWQQESYPRNEKYPEQLIHTCTSGNIVRSKSEVLIDFMLFSMKIPYRYECGLDFGSCTYYPDFTIRHPQTGELFYWEHFGMMDDINYSQKAFAKLQFYNSNGIIPSINLITTFETKSKPLGIDEIDRIIRHYFL